MPAQFEKDALDSLKNLHQLTIAACVAVLAFAIPSPPQYDKAINELVALKAVDWSLYGQLVKGAMVNRKSREDYQTVQLNLVQKSLGQVIHVPQEACFMPT